MKDHLAQLQSSSDFHQAIFDRLHGLKQLTPCLSRVSWPTPSGLSGNTWSNPSDYSKVVPNHTMYYTNHCNVSYNTIIVLYPSLLAVGGVTRDMNARIVRQDYTGAHFHALGWTSPQRVFILRHLRRESCSISILTRQFSNALSFETFLNLYSLHKSQHYLCVDFLN